LPALSRHGTLRKLVTFESSRDWLRRMAESKIFLSYRRDDSSGHTGHLYSRLADYYGPSSVFYDVKGIRPAEEFRVEIGQALDAAVILIVVISKHWSSIAAADGIRRLDQPDDYVCWEVGAAVTRGIPLLPVLFSDAAMPRRSDLPESIAALAGAQGHRISEPSWDHDFEVLISLINSLAPPVLRDAVIVNPFTPRSAIRHDTLFFNRKYEIGTLRDYLGSAQNVQVVGPRRIGKSSLLHFVQRHCTEWFPAARIAYLDLHDPRCHSLEGWLQMVAHGFGLAQAPRTLAEFMEMTDALIAGGVQPVLCLDEFGQMARRHQAFPQEVFMTLRACGQRGMSILTAAPHRLSELTDPQADTSPFFNTFPMLPLRPFTRKDAGDYVDLHREGVPGFSAAERDRIVEFAQGHPLALQAACYHVLNSRRYGDEIGAALERARDDVGRLVG
jgi:hypothetical protein